MQAALLLCAAPTRIPVQLHAICRATMAPGGNGTDCHFGELLATVRVGRFDQSGITR